MFSLKALDNCLINDFRNGSEAAFKVIYNTFSANVYAFAFSFLKDRDKSEEIVQETFIILWENRLKFDENRAFEPYLFTISKRLILDSFRKATNINLFKEKLLLKMATAHNDTEEEIMLADLIGFTERVIKDLPKQQQVVFRLSRFEGLSYDEIGLQLNLSRNTVKNHLVIALKTVRTQFARQEVIYSLLLLASLLT